MAVSWAVAPCSLVGVYRSFRGACCLYHQGPDNGGSKHRFGTDFDSELTDDAVAFNKMASVTVYNAILTDIKTDTCTSLKCKMYRKIF
jgi:hypothetical protein